MRNIRSQTDEVLGAGIDIPRSRRPGSPMESAPHDAAGSHWEEIPRQIPAGEILKRAGLSEVTPVFGSVQQPHGLSGMLRRRAYTIPDHKPRHWALLFLADRVDVAESAIADVARRRPVAAATGIVLAAGVVAGLWLAIRGVRRSRRRGRF